MKKYTLTATILLAVFISVVYAAKQYLRPMKFMSLKEVCHRYGESSLDEAQFKASGEDISIRAKMTCSLLKNQKKYVGLDSLEIRERLGEYSGHFFSESFPTYLINHAEKGGDDIRQILFLLDSKEKISKIVVHKNC